MTEVRDIFNNNIKLLGYVDKAVMFFREGRYDEALGMVAESGEYLNTVSEAVLDDRVYFAKVSTEPVVRMLTDILAAKKAKDYVLLADLYELQLSGFVSSLQEMIIEKEDFFSFNVSDYNRNIRSFELKLEEGMRKNFSTSYSADDFERLRVNRNAELEDALLPEVLLNAGYSVEFTSCGLMTLRAPMESGSSIYLHSNGNILRESFIWADRWRKAQVSEYVVYGLAFGHHLAELHELEKFAHITVFESDINIIRLYAAFGDMNLINSSRLTVVYDPERTLIEKRIAMLSKDEKACVHYPSMRRSPSGNLLLGLAPFSDIVERC